MSAVGDTKWAQWHPLHEPKSWSFDLGLSPTHVRALECSHSSKNGDQRRYIAWRFHVTAHYGLTVVFIWGDPKDDCCAVRILSDCCEAFYDTLTCSACGANRGRFPSGEGGAGSLGALKLEAVEHWLDRVRSSLEAAMLAPECLAHLRLLFGSRNRMNQVFNLPLWVEER